MTEQFKKDMAGYQKSVADYKVKQTAKQAAYERGQELNGKIDVLSGAVATAQAALSKAEAEYADTGDFALVEKAMKKLAAAESELAVANRALTPLIANAEAAYEKIQREPYGLFGPNLPFAAVCAELLRTVPEVSLFVYAFKAAYPEKISTEVVQHRFGHPIDDAAQAAALNAMIKKA